MDWQDQLSHSGYMKKPDAPINRIAEHRRARKMTQQTLAEAIGSHWITVSKLERGKMRLSDEWRSMIAQALNIDEWELVAGARPLPTVHVEGRIEEGGKIIGMDEEDTSESFHLSSDYFTHPSYRWLTVSGDALWPWYQDGDRICIMNFDPAELESVRGRLCVVWFEGKDGEEVTIGAIERGRTGGTYTVSRVGSPPIRDFKPTHVAVVAMAVYYLGPGSISEPDEMLQPYDLGTANDV
jgi:DNA-binding XRE family transcriptional regulator